MSCYTSNRGGDTQHTQPIDDSFNLLSCNDFTAEKIKWELAA